MSLVQTLKGRHFRQQLGGPRGRDGKTMFVKMVADADGYSNNDYAIAPADEGIYFSGDLTQYVLAWEAPAANSVGSGSISVEIKDSAGASVATLQLSDENLAALTPNVMRTRDLIFARRLTAEEDAFQRLLWMRPTDNATRELSRWLPAIMELGERRSTVRPLVYTKAQAKAHFIDMRFDESKYDSGQARRHSDMFRVVEHDLTDTMTSVPGNALAINSLLTRARGRAQHDLNMQFTELLASVIVDTGRDPTIIEPPIHGGAYGDPVADYKVSGLGHAFILWASTTLAMIVNDLSTGNVDDEIEIDPDAAIGFELGGDRLVKTVSMPCVNEAADVYCVQTHVVTYDPAATDQIRVQSAHDFTDPTLTVTPGMIRGFGMVFAGTDIDRCQAIVDGVPGAVLEIDTRDNDELGIGFPEQVAFWHSDFPEKQIIVTNNLGYGFTHEENGVPIANGSAQSYVASFADYLKLYGGLFGDHGGAPTPRDMTGIVVTTDFGIRFVLADPRS